MKASLQTIGTVLLLVGGVLLIWLKTREPYRPPLSEEESKRAFELLKLGSQAEKRSVSLTMTSATGNPSVSQPEVLQSNSGFRGDEYALTLRNRGAAGKVLVKFTFTDDPVRHDAVYSAESRVVYFEADEERTITLPIPENLRGKPLALELKVQGGHSGVR